MDHPNLFGRWFRGDSWNPWRSFLASLFALPHDVPNSLRRSKPVLAAAMRRINHLPRPGRIAADVAENRPSLHSLRRILACFRDLRRRILAPGEVATIRIMASDREQARTIFRYLAAMLR